MAENRNVTIVEVGNRSGVSRMTVSRVINNDPKVAAATVTRVQAAMAELGYVPPPPNERFRRPSRRKYGIRTENIALLIPDPGAETMRTPISASLAQGAENLLHEEHLNLIVTHLRGVDQLPNCIEKRQIDGAIVRGGDFSPEFFAHLHHQPCVWVLEIRHDPPYGDIVMPDNVAIGRLAARNLAEQGCRCVAVARPRQDKPAYTTRCNAFYHMAQELGLVVETVPFEELCSRRDFDGVFLLTSTEHEPLRLTRALAEIGIEPERDIKIVAVDEIGVRETAEWPFTAIDPRMTEVGRAAAQQLLWRMRHPHEAQRKILIKPELVRDGVTAMARQ